MGRDVVVVASGDTERRALPHLLKHLLGAELASPVDVRISPHGLLTVGIAERIVKATWWERHGRGTPPDKIVVLVDADTRSRDEKLLEFDELPRRLADLPVAVKLAVAKWHLEAWFFADADGLRACLGGRSLGPLGADPDDMPFPKQRLRNLLDVPYTSRVAERIATAISTDVMRQRSLSFAHFEAAVKNGRS
jgi:Domain of unknown function (DUF4276)